MFSKNPWLTEARGTITSTKIWLANLSIKVRSSQYRIFDKIFNPSASATVVDVGVTSDELLKDSNLFERLYPFPTKLTAVTIEDPKRFHKLYPAIKKVVKVVPHSQLPFKSRQFDIVVSWATLEHVGSYRQQEFFLNELLRVGKNIFVTTPYRYCIYEPHTGFFFLHWLPLSWFRGICRLTGRQFWTSVTNLNPLAVRDIRRMRLIRPVYVKIYKMFGWLPTHLIITDVPL